MPKKVEDCVTSFMQSDYNKKRWPDEDERRQAAYAICNASVSNNEERRKRRMYMVSLAENMEDTWVHILPYGEFYHPIFGDINVTEERVDHFIANFKEGVRGIQLDIDYAHKGDVAKGDKAAGWIQELEKRADGLWGSVEWTSEALQEIQDGAWKYMSAEYVDSYCSAKKTEGEDPKCWDDVLLGAALTNRPYMKELTPINFSEFFDVPEGKVSQEDANYRAASDSMYRCANCEFFRPDSSSCLVVDGDIDGDWTSDYFRPIYNEMVDSMMYSFTEDGRVTLQLTMKDEPQKEVKQLNEFLQKLLQALGVTEEVKEGEEEKAEETVLSEIRTLSEKLKEVPKPDPETEKAKKFAELFPEEAAQLAEQSVKLREAHVDKKFGEWTRVPPVLHETLKPYMVGLSASTLSEFETIMDTINEKGLVDLGEKGSSRSD